MSDLIFCELADRAVLRITGEDRADFLQNLISNDIDKASGDQMIYALLLTPQGKFLFDFFICEEEEGFLLETQKSQLDELIKKLTLYRLRAKVELNPEEKLKVWFIWSPQNQDQKFSEKRIFRDPRGSNFGWRQLSATPPENIPRAPIENYHRHRIMLGIPEAGRELTSARFPLECSLDRLNAIDFNKGCYIGQEVTSRLHRRADGGRRRMAVVQSRRDLPAAQTPILAETKPVGQLLSAQGNIGLAVIRTDRLNNAQPCIEGEPVKLDFMV